MTSQLVPDRTQMRRYLERGLTQAKIVEQWEADSGIRVSRSAIAMAIKRYELESAHERPRYEDMLPWRVKDEHKTHWDARMLRLEARRRRGKDLTDAQLRWVADWKRLLDDRGAVVMYDPDTPEGFYWVVREKTDDDIIRRPRRAS